MRKVAFCAGALLALGGCGYVGPVLPPSPQLPPAVTDLTVVERGAELQIAFSTPARTTDNLPIREFSQVDLRVGPAVSPFDFDRWAAGARSYAVEPPAPGNTDDPQAATVSRVIPVSDWLGKRVTVAVRTAVRKGDHFSSWSNRVTLEVVKPLEPPVLTAMATPTGVLVSWPSSPGATGYRIYRQGSGDKTPVEIGTATSLEYLDTSAQYDTPYVYTAVATEGVAESLGSKPEPITPIDTFPPSVPASITVLAAPNAVEITWQRSPETDLKGYFLYRAVNGAAFERLGGLLNLPAYSDRNVEHGKTYRYQVSAVDRKNNESARSSPAETAF